MKKRAIAKDRDRQKETVYLWHTLLRHERDNLTEVQCRELVRTVWESYGSGLRCPVVIIKPRLEYSYSQSSICGNIKIVLCKGGMNREIVLHEVAHAIISAHCYAQNKRPPEGHGPVFMRVLLDLYAIYAHGVVARAMNRSLAWLLRIKISDIISLQQFEVKYGTNQRI